MGNKSNISILSKNECCGCRACHDICPKKCINFTEDSEGFFYPLVNESICISCGKCIKICPELNPTYHKPTNTSIAAYAENIKDRESGSSGGIFGLLAQNLIKKGGKVWGAAFDKNLTLSHQCATNNAELDKLYKSKYLQSNTQDIFSAIKIDIGNKVLTLFSGTPCQCNAIRNYIGENPYLITVEVVCHGVPSQNLFDKSIKWLEHKNNCNVEAFQFRSKYKNALHPQAYTYICRKNNKRQIVSGLHYQFPFYFGFQKYITLRPACYECKWATPGRCADITLGDFWGIEKFKPELNTKEGVSMVILNTEKGNEIFEELITANSVWQQNVPIEIALNNNGCLVSPTKLKPERSEFFNSLNSQPFEEVVRLHLRPKRQWVFDIYYGLPKILRRCVRKIMDKRIRYE